MSAGEARAEARTPTPYYSDDLTTLYCADNADVLPLLSGVDLVFTSPPYNLGVRPDGSKTGFHNGSHAGRKLIGGYEDHTDDLPPDVYDTWLTNVVALAWLTLSPVGAVFFNHKPRPIGGSLVLPLQYGEGLPLRQIIVWDRRTGVSFSEQAFMGKHEWIVIWARPAWRLASRSASQVGDVWWVPPETGNPHPAPFPVSLPARAIETTAPSLVLDPFCGSGSTLVAAKAAGVRSIGIEKSERYCEMAVKRLAQEALVFDA